jgi:hypothetical protein
VWPSIPAAILVAAVVATAGCGGSGSDQLASLAPPDVPLYAEITLRPDDDQEAAISSFTRRVAGIGDPEAVLVTELDRALARDEAEISFDDIDPWLGDRASVFVRSFEPVDVADDVPVSGDVPDFAVAVEVTDVGETRTFLERAAESDPDPEEERSYKGVDYTLDSDEGIAVGFIDDHLVFGTEPSFKVAVEASEGDPLVSAFVEPGEVIDGLLSSSHENPADARFLRPVLAGPLAGPVGISLSATPTAASLEMAAVQEGGEQPSGSSLLEALPAGSWLAAAARDLGAPLTQLLEQLDSSGLPNTGSWQRRFRMETGLDLRADVLGWLGDTAVFAQGSASPLFRAGLIAETDDRDAPRALLERVERRVEQSTGLRSAGAPPEADYGFRIGIPSLGRGVEAGVVGQRLVAVIGGSIAQVLDAPETLADDASYRAAREALGADLSPALYVRLRGLLDLVERGDPRPEFRAAVPYLAGFDSLIAGHRAEDGMALWRLTLTLAQ